MTSRHRYVALLRAVTNVPMKPFRDAMEDMGFTDIESYATSGNLLFDAPTTDARPLERAIAERLGTNQPLPISGLKERTILADLGLSGTFRTYV